MIRMARSRTVWRHGGRGTGGGGGCKLGAPCGLHTVQYSTVQYSVHSQSVGAQILGRGGSWFALSFLFGGVRGVFWECLPCLVALRCGCDSYPRNEERISVTPSSVRRCMPRYGHVVIGGEFYACLLPLLCSALLGSYSHLPSHRGCRAWPGLTESRREASRLSGSGPLSSGARGKLDGCWIGVDGVDGVPKTDRLGRGQGFGHEVGEHKE